jgi:Sec-independent protein translocase protein TatA
MPSLASLVVAYLLVALLIALALFPNLEARLPEIMRSAGSLIGRIQRRLRGFSVR